MSARVNAKQVSLFATFILLTLTLTLNHAYATTIAVGSHPTEVAFDSYLDEIFVSNFRSNTVSVISDATNRVIANISVGSYPHGVAFDSNMREVFVANNVSGTISVLSG
jgi:YVTN family beta-propeller protein